MDVGELLAVVLSLATLLGGVVVILAGLRYRTRMVELKHQERLAMIEKGLMPPPEFDLVPALITRHPAEGLPIQRSRSLGIIVVGLGFAMMFLIGIAGGALDAGIGIGGAVVILGAAFIVRSMVAAPAGPPPWVRTPPFPPAGPSGEPPQP